MKTTFKSTSEHGLCPKGQVDPDKLLAWLNERIVDANSAIYAAAMNGSDHPGAAARKAAYKELKNTLFGDLYDT